jgi:CRISPR-associated protein Csa5
VLRGLISEERGINMSLSELAKALAVLVTEEGNYTYVDKLGYVPSRDLTVFYLREALRDLHSLLRQEKFENKKAEELAKKIEFDKIETALEILTKISDKKELREKTSLIAAKALAISAKLRGGGASE